MDPVASVKQALNPSRIIGWTLVAIAAFAIADLLNLTDWIMYPVTTFKGKFLNK